MKNIFLIFAAGIFAMGLTACGKTEAEKQKEQKEAATPHFKATPIPDQKNYKSPKL